MTVGSTAVFGDLSVSLGCEQWLQSQEVKDGTTGMHHCQHLPYMCMQDEPKVLQDLSHAQILWCKVDDGHLTSRSGSSP